MRRPVGTGIVAVLPGKFFKSLRNHTSHQVGGLFGGILVVRFDITEPLRFVQDAQDVMVLFDERLAVLVLCSVRVLDEPSAGRDACMSRLLGGEWNKQVYNKYIFTARLLGCVWMLGRGLKLTREHLAVAPCTRLTQFLYH